MKTSEFFKHLKTPVDSGCVSKDNKTCSLIMIGLGVLNRLEEIMNTEPKIPKVE